MVCSASPFLTSGWPSLHCFSWSFLLHIAWHTALLGHKCQLISLPCWLRKFLKMVRRTIQAQPGGGIPSLLHKLSWMVNIPFKHNQEVAFRAWHINSHKRSDVPSDYCFSRAGSGLPQQLNFSTYLGSLPKWLLVWRLQLNGIQGACGSSHGGLTFSALLSIVSFHFRKFSLKIFS